MNKNIKTLLQFSNLSLSYDNKSLFNSISGSTNADDRIGLIGINGSGKSSLLKILSGITLPDKGIVNKKVELEYVPQIDFNLYRKEILLFRHIESSYDDWWKILQEYEKLFGKTLDENRTLDTLSCGELTKLNITIALVKNPDLILFDEPTNHLDLKSLNQLDLILKGTNTPFIIVSHNTRFLNSVVNRIWEIDNEKLIVYGGNYDFYKTEKERRINSQLELYEVEKKQLKKEKLNLQKDNILFARKQAKLSKMAKINDRSIPKIFRTAMKLQVQTNFGSNKIKKEKSIERSKKNLESLKLVKRKNIYLDLRSEQKNGLIISITGGKLNLANKSLLIKNINFNIYHQDRIAILGDNGSGKTTFVKQLSYNSHPLLSGAIKYGSEYKALYVDQKYDLVKPEKTIIENVKLTNPNLNYENIRKVLGNISFASEFDLNKNAGDLSGGEIARLAFAIATNSHVNFLILDEPTNNLDIETVDVISESLRNFRGTLVVISHNLSFLKEIKINRVFEISSKTIISRNIDEVF